MADLVKEKVIHELLYDPKGKFNIDCLLDCIVALYNDCNAPAIKANKNIKNFIEKFEPIVNRVQNLRPRISDYQKIKAIGRGAFGEVQLCRHKTTKKVHAMKILSKTEITKRSETAFFWEERDIMATTTSPWIVSMSQAFQDKKHLYIVMEFMPGGDLVYLMTNYDIPLKWAKFYCAEAVLAVNAIHEMGFIHRDIKPDNMLLDGLGHLKLADFGTCLKMDKNKKVKSDTAVGTPDYISPEVLSSQGRQAIYGREVDWWSLGVVLYEMLLDDPPFYSDGLVGTYGKILDFQNTLKFDRPIDKEAEDLIRKFLSAQHVRYGRNGLSSEILEHKFFENDEWTWENIRESIPPFSVDVKSEIDTQHFDEIAERTDEVEAFATPRAYVGNHLPFVGFTYSDKPNWIPKAAPPVGGQQPASQPSLTTAVPDGRSKELEAQLREKEKELRSRVAKIELLERQRADSEGRVTKMEQEKRKMESLKKESSRSQEENLKKIIAYEADLSQLKSNLAEESQFRRRDQERIRMLTRELQDEKEKLQSTLDSQSVQRREVQQQKYAYTELENQVRDLSTKFNNSKLEAGKLRDELKNERDVLSKSSSQETMKNVSLTSELQHLKYNFSELKESSERDAKRLRSELDMVTRKKQVIERESESRKRKIEELNSDLSLARDSNMKAVKTEATRQRMSLEEENQKMKEAMRDLEDKCAKAEFDVKQKEERIQQLEKDSLALTTKQNVQIARTDSISRENHQLKIRLEQSLREQDIRIRSETRQKTDQYESKIIDLKELLEREKKKSETLDKQLGELHDQHETQQYFATLYKSQVREKKDELEDERANIEALNTRIQQLEQEKAKLHVSHMKVTEEKQQRFNQELDRLHNESSGISQREVEEAKNRIHELEQALFNANDSYEDVNRENESFRERLDQLEGIEEHIHQERMQWMDEKQQLETKLNQETLLKKQSVNKLVQVMTKKLPESSTPKGRTTRNLREDLRKAERKVKEYEGREREQIGVHTNIVKNKDSEIEQLRDVIQKESSNLEEKQMENESLRMELQAAQKNLEDMKVTNTLTKTNLSLSTLSLDAGPKKGWLEIPSARGIGSARRDGGWIKVFVVLSDDRLFFYAGQKEYNAHQPKKIIEISKLYHVRQVTKNDAFRAKDFEIPRMFQIMYGEEGLALQGDPTSKYAHNFIRMTYRTPTDCDFEGCTTTMWGMIRAPEAVACRKCNQKYHASHVAQHSPDLIKLPQCRSIVAEEMLVLATDTGDQSEWIRCLSKKIGENNPGGRNDAAQYLHRHSPITVSIKQRLKPSK